MAKIDEKHEKIQKILVVGDSRLADSILDGLISGSFEVHQVISLGSSTHRNSSVAIHRNDMSIQAMANICNKISPDVIFSTCALSSYKIQKQLIDAAIEAQVPRFAMLEFSQDALNKKIQERLPPYRQRAQIVQYLQNRAAETGISWVSVAMGVVLNQGLVNESLGFDLKWHSATVFGTGEEKFPASSTSWVENIVLAVVERWDLVRNQLVYAASMIVSAHEIVQALQKATGQKWEVGYVDVEDGVREAERRFERGFPDAGMLLMERSVLYDTGLDAKASFAQSDGKSLLGLTDESLEVVVHNAIHQFERHGKGGCGCGN